MQAVIYMCVCVYVICINNVTLTRSSVYTIRAVTDWLCLLSLSPCHESRLKRCRTLCLIIVSTQETGTGSWLDWSRASSLSTVHAAVLWKRTRWGTLLWYIMTELCVLSKSQKTRANQARTALCSQETYPLLSLSHQRSSVLFSYCELGAKLQEWLQ